MWESSEVSTDPLESTTLLSYFETLKDTSYYFFLFQTNAGYPCSET